MRTPTEALHNLNEIKEKYDNIKLKILKLLDEDDKIKSEINKYLSEIEFLEENYADLIGDLIQQNEII